MKFKGKRVFVTGAASGIGRATAEKFAAEGASLFIADLNQEGLEKVAGELAGSAGEIVTFQLNVGDREACENAVEQCVSQLDGIDVLCNIAGIAGPQHFTDISPERWKLMLDVNVNGVFWLCQLAMPHLLESGGNIVNMSSSAGITGQAYNTSYCATKGAVLMLTKAIAMEYAQKGVRANAVCPGAVNTPLAADFVMPEGGDFKLLERLFPLYEMAQPEEIASAIAYLASDEARFITGIGLPIDGGQTCG